MLQKKILCEHGQIQEKKQYIYESTLIETDKKVQRPQPTGTEVDAVGEPMVRFTSGKKGCCQK
jgi:hypothetical protein